MIFFALLTLHLKIYKSLSVTTGELLEVGPLQPVTSLCHHGRYVLIEFKDLDVFQRLAFLNGLCVGVPFPETSYYCFMGLWTSVELEAKGQGGWSLPRVTGKRAEYIFGSGS